MSIIGAWGFKNARASPCPFTPTYPAEQLDVKTKPEDAKSLDRLWREDADGHLLDELAAIICIRSPEY
jgi:hypothetical protein